MKTLSLARVKATYANASGMPLHELYNLVLDKIGYIDFIKASEDDPEPRIENIKE